MRSLKQYIAESVHYYDYTIKIVGELDSKWVDLFKYNLKKFDPIELSGPTVTPVQKFPVGFPEMTNEPVNIIKAKFRYPATEPMIQQMARLLGLDENRVRVNSSGYEDTIARETEQYENQLDSSPLLLNDYPDDTVAKDASKAYSNSYLDSIKEQSKDSKIDIPFSGEKTKIEFDPFKPEEHQSSQGKNSPMSKITRSAKPKTGAGR